MEELPVVAGLAYRETLRSLPETFTAVLVPEPANRYNPNAIAVLVDAAKIGYVAPEVARRFFSAVQERTERGEAVTCRGRMWVNRGRVDVMALLECDNLETGGE